MKPFDLEAAKRGEPILLMLANEYDMTPVRLVGMLTDGRHVVERRADSGVYYVEVATEHRLRMVPKKKTVYLNIHPRGEYFMHESAESARSGADNGSGGIASEILAVAVPVEIEV
jgi:hypothetical protein